MMSVRRYRDNVDVKQNFDRLQADYECCGDMRYTDWFRVSWVADEYVDTTDPDIRDHVRSGSGYQSDDVPFSCCSSASRRPCITQFIHDNKKHFNYDYQVTYCTIIAPCCEHNMHCGKFHLNMSIGGDSHTVGEAIVDVGAATHTRRCPNSDDV